jgi:selenocysteine-specific elongation factor
MLIAMPWVVSSEAIHDLQRQLISGVDRYHEVNPLEPGMPLQILRSRLRAAPEIFESVVQSKIDDGSITIGAGFVALGAFVPAPTVEQHRAIDKLMSILVTAQSEPPTVEELSAALQCDVSALLRYMERSGIVIQVERNRYYETLALDILLARLRDALSGGAELSPSQLRVDLALSRKFLIPLLEYSDRMGYTNRGTTGRVWRGG